MVETLEIAVGLSLLGLQTLDSDCARLFDSSRVLEGALAHAIGRSNLMPPEPPPWDRKDFYKERKHERSESASVGSVARWRETPHHGPRDFVRWGSADFRRPPG